MFDKIAGRKPPGTVSKKFRLNIFLVFTVFNAVVTFVPSPRTTTASATVK